MPEVATRTMASVRKTVPEPKQHEAGISILFHVPVHTAELLTAEVRRRNTAYPMAPEWTLARLMEDVVREKFGKK